MTSITLPRQESLASTRLYLAVWFWHFHAGLYVAPFLFMLALSGLIMVYGNSIETFVGKKYSVAPGGQRVSFSEQVKLAVDSVPGGKLKYFVKPATDNRANVFIVTDAAGKEQVVAVDPHGPKVLGSEVEDDTWFYWAHRLHGNLFIGSKSNGLDGRLIEIAAGLGVLLVATGLYMWWPRAGKGWSVTRFPNLGASGSGLWKELHVSVGFYMSIALVVFFVSGLSWAGVWGEKNVQAWSTFPAAKWDNVPLSDQTHAGMNHGALKEVPWTLEQTPMPESGSLAGPSDPLFVNKMTDHPHRTNMALTSAMNQQKLGHPVTIFFYDKGVLVETTKNVETFGGQQKTAADIKAAGGDLVVCPMCLKHYGVAEGDLIPGAEVSNPEKTGAALFRDNGRTLTW